MYRKYYTLRKRDPNNPIKQKIIDIEFDSYKDAFAEMCKLFMLSEEMWGIWRTTICDNNSMTKAVWED